MARKYSKKTQNTVKQVLHKFKKGILKSGQSNKIVTSREQAIAIGLSEARKQGELIPAPEKKNKPQSSRKSNTKTDRATSPHSKSKRWRLQKIKREEKQQK